MFQYDGAIICINGKYNAFYACQRAIANGIPTSQAFYSSYNRLSYTCSQAWEVQLTHGLCLHPSHWSNFPHTYPTNGPFHPISPHFTYFHPFSPPSTPFHPFHPISPLSPHFTTFTPFHSFPPIFTTTFHPFHPISPHFTPSHRFSPPLFIPFTHFTLFNHFSLLSSSHYHTFSV